MRRSAVLLPALIGALLSLPCLNYTFLWDDYHFLSNALTSNFVDWLPRADDPFYRPISRALYFAIVGPMGTSGAFLAHLLNLVYLILAVVALTALATRIRGRGYGLLAGTLFASMAAVPTLVAWASCSQDLLAIDFTLVALIARWDRRDGVAILAFAMALLSKETAISVAPALVGLDWILLRDRRSLARNAMSFGAVIIAWAIIHPAVGVLLERGFAPGATGYVGLTGPRTWVGFAARYLAVLSNSRLGAFTPTWSKVTTVYLAMIALGSAFLFCIVAREQAVPDRRESLRQVSAARVAWFGLSLAIPPLMMTSMIINSWAPYYAAFPMVGGSLLGALALGRLRASVRPFALGLYLLLGIWARGSNVDSLHMTERALRPSSDAMRRIENGFHELAPRLPRNTDVVLSVQASGIPRVYVQMYVFQPLRLWYWDPTLRVVKPLRFHPTSRPVLLAMITPDMDVVFLDPNTFAAHSASGQAPDYYDCEKALRAFATGLAGAGFAEQGSQVLLRMPNISAATKGRHERAAAMLLLGSGRSEQADSLIAVATPISRIEALGNLHALLAEQPREVIYDDFALRAYGIASDDVEALRDLANWLSAYGYAEPAHRLASRLLQLSPGDPVGIRALAIADSTLNERRTWSVDL